MVLILFSTLSTPAWAGSSEAASKIREGIAQFKGGDFKAASEAFAAADDSMPNELKIAFDRGCAYAADKQYDKAVEQFQKAAAAPDHKLAALAQYNLGSAAVAQAKDILGAKPEEAEGDARTASLEFIAQAAKHYRDCLGIDPLNSDARYNLETLRLWTKYIQDLWQQRDRQKRRNAMDLLQYLQWLETEERGLKQSSKELDGTKASPKQREAVRAVENSQRTLAEEIEPLKEKIVSSLTAPQQQPGKNVATSPSADVQKAVELLDRLADDIHRAMGKAADSLAGGSPVDAVKSQSQAVENIDQIFMAVAPYVNLVQKGISRQEELINQSPASEKQNKPEEQNVPANQAQAQIPPTNFDSAETAWNQRFVARYGRILSAKAKRELEQLESMPATPQPQPPEQEATSATPYANSTPAADKDQQPNDAQLKADEQRRELKEALQMGVQSAPKVEKLADEAASLLEEDNPAEALPKQQEALKLLKEMLPKQQQQDQDKKDQEKKDQEKKDKDKKDQDKKDQQNQDQNKQDQEKKDQSKQDQQKKEQQNKDQQNKEQNKQDQQKKNQDKQQQQQNQQQQKRDVNKEQADAVLHKARQREEQYRKLEKLLEGYLYRPEKVEKDW